MPKTKQNAYLQTKEQQEMCELHDAYCKHEYHAFASVMNGGDMATMYVCHCGGSLATSRCYHTSGPVNPQPTYIFQDRGIVPDWVDVVVRVIASNPLARTAWGRLGFEPMKDRAKASNQKLVRDAEKKYGLR